MSDHPIAVFVIFFVIAFVNWLIRKGAKDDAGGGSSTTTQARPSRPQQSPQAQQSEEERLRKFMEALGVPAGNIPPPRQIVRPQPLQQPRPTPQPYRAAPLPRRQKQQPRRVVPEVVYAPTPPPVVQAQQSAYFETEPQPVAPGASSATDATQTLVPMSVSTDTRPAAFADLRSLLKSPSSIRSAIVLREILGPPRALQSLDSARSLL